MRSISELDLIVIIPLVANHLVEKESELKSIEKRADELSDEEIDAKCDLQEHIILIEDVLSRLKRQYMNALDDRINLPAYETLVSMIPRP